MNCPMTRPLATIVLDTPNSTGPVRGVACWTMVDAAIYVLDPRHGETAHPEATRIYDLVQAMKYIHDSWAVGDPDGETWGLQWLCEDVEDFG